MKKSYNKRLSIAFIVVVIAALVVMGAVTMNIDKKEPYRMVYVPKTIDEANGFWTSLIEGVQMGAEEYGADVQVEVKAGESEEDYEGQNECIEAAIAEAPDAILVSPCSYTESVEILERVVDAGIPLVLIDSEIEKDIGQIIVATDNHAAGVELGKYARTLVDSDTQIGIVGHVKGASTAIEREQGVRDGLGEYEECIQEVVFCGSSYDRAYRLTEEMIQDYPDIGMIVGLNEYSALGVARAVEDLGLKDQVQVVGFDSSVEQIQLMERGVFRGVVIQKPFNMGYLGIKQAVKLVEGKEVRKSLKSGSKLITMDNLYEEENQRLLYPFTGQQ